jgi:hypothetical protein
MPANISKRLKRRFYKTKEFITQNDGEIWTVEDLYQTAAELENIRDEMVDSDSNIESWVDSQINPLIELLVDAAESLIDEGLDEGEVYFTED